MIYYLDASALVKRYAREPGADWITELLRSGARRATGTVGVIEVLSALARKERSGELAPARADQARAALDEDVRSIDLIDFGPSVYRTALQIPTQHGLRGCDAIHLASAMTLRAHRGDEVVSFVTADAELGRAATAARFPVIDPAREED